MQNKLAATFGMPRLFPNPFSPFFPLFRRFAVAYLNAAGQQKKKESRRKRKICDNFVSLSLVSGWATKILGNILGPVSIFLAPRCFSTSYFTTNKNSCQLPESH